jgi:predicted GTPase
VGKSTLFNKFSQTIKAITDPTPGLTRDRKEVVTHLLEYPVK